MTRAHGHDELAPSVPAERLVGALLAAEDTAGSEDVAWLRGILEAVGELLDHGLGVMGWFFDPRSGFVPTAPTALGGAEELVGAAVRVHAALGTSSLAKALAGPPALVVASEAHGLGRDLLRDRAYVEHAHPLGIRDFLALKAVSPCGRAGCLIGAPLPDIGSSARYRRTPWHLLAKHMSFALAAPARRPRGAVAPVSAGDVLGGLDADERAIIHAMVAGTPNKDIAKAMHLAPRTLERRITIIAHKLDIHVPRGTRVRGILGRILGT